MKPTLELAILRSPGHGARRLLRTLAAGDADPWRARAETPSCRYEFFVGTPPGPEAHGALVLVDAAQGVTPMLRRALWHARRRGVRHLVGVFVCDVRDADLLELAELDLRHCLDEFGFTADEIPFCRLAWPEAAAARLELLGTIESAIPHGPLRRDTLAPNEQQIVDALHRCVFRRTGSRLLFWPELWRDLRGGVDSRRVADDRWRLHVILHHAVRGDFDDLPDLLPLAAHHGTDDWQYRALSLDLLAHVGTWELAPLLRRFDGDFTNAGDVCEGMSYWLYLACVPLLLDLFSVDRYVLFRYSWAIQQILEEEHGDVLRNRWERQVSEADLKIFTAEAERRCGALVARLGSETAVVLHGEPFSGRRTAELLLSRAARGGFVDHLAALFVAQTGLSPDRDSVTRFLDSGEADRRPPVRHFLGTPIADFSQAQIQERDGR